MSNHEVQHDQQPADVTAKTTPATTPDRRDPLFRLTNVAAFGIHGSSKAIKRPLWQARGLFWMLGVLLVLVLVPVTSQQPLGFGGAYGAAGSSSHPASKHGTTPSLSSQPTPGASSSGSNACTGTSASGYPAVGSSGGCGGCTPEAASQQSQYPEAANSSGCSTTVPTSSSSSWLQDAFNGFLNSIWQGCLSLLQKIIDVLSSFGFMVITPKDLTYGHHVVINLYNWVVTIMDAMIGLFLIIGGYNFMFGSYQSFRELAPRLVLAGVAGHVSLSVLSQFIELNNTLCTGVLGVVASSGVGLDVHNPLHWMLNLLNAPGYFVLVYAVALIAALLLSVQMLLRIAMLDLLLILSPLGLLCFALPQTQAWGRLWAQALVSTLIVQFFQIICIGLGAALIGSFGRTSFTPMTYLVGLAALFLASKLPDMVLSNVLRTRHAKELAGKVGDTAETAVEMAALIA